MIKVNRLSTLVSRSDLVLYGMPDVYIRYHWAITNTITITRCDWYQIMPRGPDWNAPEKKPSLKLMMRSINFRVIVFIAKCHRTENFHLSQQHKIITATIWTLYNITFDRTRQYLTLNQFWHLHFLLGKNEFTLTVAWRWNIVYWSRLKI